MNACPKVCGDTHCTNFGGGRAESIKSWFVGMGTTRVRKGGEVAAWKQLAVNACDESDDEEGVVPLTAGNLFTLSLVIVSCSMLINYYYVYPAFETELPSVLQSEHRPEQTTTSARAQVVQPRHTTNVHGRIEKDPIEPTAPERTINKVQNPLLVHILSPKCPAKDGGQNSHDCRVPSAALRFQIENLEENEIVSRVLWIDGREFPIGNLKARKTRYTKKYNTTISLDGLKKFETHTITVKVETLDHSRVARSSVIFVFDDSTPPSKRREKRRKKTNTKQPNKPGQKRKFPKTEPHYNAPVPDLHGHKDDLPWEEMKRRHYLDPAETTLDYLELSVQDLNNVLSEDLAQSSDDAAREWALKELKLVKEVLRIRKGN